MKNVTMYCDDREWQLYNAIINTGKARNAICYFILFRYSGLLLYTKEFIEKYLP